jgi:hypothetical protein
MRKGTTRAASAGLVLAGAVLAVAAADRVQDAQDTPEGGLDEATVKLMSPGPMHAHLAPLVGSWDLTTRYRMTPEAPWEESTARAEREWILDGRFVKETVEAEYMNQPFHGIGFFGYDNVREEYGFVWLDNMVTGMMTASGSSSDGGTTITFEGTNADPMSGEKDAWFRHVLRIVSDDENVFEMYARDPGGGEFQTMEIRATRAGASAPRFTPGSCCDLAASLGGACTHACCVTAQRQGRVCSNCN